jgi:hypothetical protein
VAALNKRFSLKDRNYYVSALLLGLVASIGPCSAQGFIDTQNGAGNITSPVNPTNLIAQQTPPQDNELKDVLPLDLTPVSLPERRGAFDGLQTGIMYKVPAKMFFNTTVENSLRLETNIFQTSTHQRQDMIYRVLPNVTLGYALSKNRRIAANYFYLRDQYMHNYSLMTRNIHSVGFKADQDFQVGKKTTLTASIFARELFATRSVPLSDIIPSLVAVRRVGDRQIVYASILGQVRFQEVLKRYQEFDQFYSFGTVYRRNLWQMSFDNTFITNFGKRQLRGGPNNQIFVLTGEVARQVHRKVPISAFVRAEPIFNMGANSSTGFAGFNFRIYGGLRTTFSKPAIFPIKFNQS